jgi:uncharacterized protein with HEPN domain
MMNKIELQQFLNRISNLIRDVDASLAQQSQDNFRMEPDVKERVYFMLQEIGRNSEEVVAYYYGEEQNSELFPLLTSLKTAKYHLFNELNDQVVFNIVKNELPNIQKNVNKKLRELDVEETTL